MGRPNLQLKMLVELELSSLTRRALTAINPQIPNSPLLNRKIHIMGSFQNIKVARDAVVSLILGSPPGKVYAGLRTVSSRMKQRSL